MKVNGVLALWIGLNVISHSSAEEFPEEFPVEFLRPVIPNPPSVAFELKDGTLPLGYNFVPAVMQCLAYYSEMLQYEQLATTTIEPPLGEKYTTPLVQGDGTVTTKKPSVTPTRQTTSTTRKTTVEQKTTTKNPPQRTTTTTRKPTTSKIITRSTKKTTTRSTSRSTTKKPVTTTISYPYSTVYNIWYNPEATTPSHKPGYFSPQKPPRPQKPVYYVKPKPTSTTQKSTTVQRTTQKPVYYMKPKPSSTTQRTTQKSSTVQRTTQKTPSTQRTTQKTSTTQKQTTVKRSTQRPVTTSTRKPNYSDRTEKPTKPEQSYQKPDQKPDTVNDPNWQDQSFVEWFFQAKPQKTEELDENELQLLDPLPKLLLFDISYEKTFLPALLDRDNVNEFRKVYDDSYNRKHKTRPNQHQMKVQMMIQKLQQRVMITGHKKVPITKTYVDFMILYDLLKRDAKTSGLGNTGGYNKEQLKELAESSKHSADYQLHFLLKKMLDRDECKRKDAVSRAQSVLKDLEDSNSITSKALRYIPPLTFLP